MHNTVLGGGYTCSCGKYNRTSTICFCDNFDIKNKPVITANNNGVYMLLGKENVENTKDFILLLKSNKEIFKSFLIRAYNMNEAIIIANNIRINNNLSNTGDDLVIELTNNYKYLTINCEK